MSITRQTIKRLERELNSKDGYLVMPLMATPAEQKTIKARAEREGKEVRGIPLTPLSKKRREDYLNKLAKD